MAQINEWLSIDKANGSGDATITLTASSSTELTERMASLEIKGVTKSVYINITQDAYVAPSKNNDYFWIKLEESGDIQGLRTTFEYSYNLTNWNSCPTTLNVPADTYVWFRNTSSILNAENTSTILFTERGIVGGDLSSIGDMRESNFRLLFNYNNYLTDASELILPWNTLASYCYMGMFQFCTSLVYAPVLPATALAGNCYNYMFRGCESLITAPSLPATELVWSCYNGMFEKCKSLTTAPALPATTLTNYCYQFMFRNCTSLTTTPVLPATILAQECYQNMFEGCTGLTTISRIGAIAIGLSAKYMFHNCTSLTEFEVGEWVTDMSSWSMFDGCTNLKTIIAHPSTAPTIRSDTFRGIAEDGTLIYPTGSDYSSWLSTNTYYLGYYGWNETESGGGNEEEGDDEENNDYFWIEFEDTNATVKIVRGGSASYSFDGVDWVNGVDRISMGDNKVVYLKDLINSSNSINGNAGISFTKYAKVGGNLSSLREMGEGAFSDLFSFETYLRDASELILPWDVLAKNCYYQMFTSCDNLVTAPKLPATTLAEWCYYQMFGYCDNLINIPELPATTLANGCYMYMFTNCTSLVNAPTLPATTLANDCYYAMFDDCTSLVNAPVLPATTLAEECYERMFYGCTSLVNAPVLPATTLAEGCYRGMFQNCTSLVTAPALPATTLAEECYTTMFRGCTNLNYIKMLATDISADGCLSSWVERVGSTGTFVKHPDANLPTGVDGIPKRWTIQEIA